MKKFAALFLSLIMLFTLSVPAFAAEPDATYDPYSIDAHYVQELVDLSQEEIAALPLEQAKELFEKAFSVSANDYTEDEVRLVLDGLGYGFKFEIFMDEVRATTDYEVIDPTLRSSTGNYYYTGDIGVAWVRDTTSGHSPLTLGEILSGTYTLEVDYLTWSTASSIITASLNESAFNQLVNYLGSGATGAVIGKFIVDKLGLKGKVAWVATVAVGAAVAKGWDWFRHFDRDNMNNTLQDMDQYDDLMKVQFMWSSNMVNRFHTNITRTNTITNPFPGTYGTWHKDSYGYLYSY